MSDVLPVYEYDRLIRICKRDIERLRERIRSAEDALDVLSGTYTKDVVKICAMKDMLTICRYAISGLEEEKLLTTYLEEYDGYNNS